MSTPTIETTDWHPSWCTIAPECTERLTPDDHHHEAELVRLPRVQDDDFTVTTRWEAFGTEDGAADYAVEYGLELQVTSEAFRGHHATLFMSADRMRQLAHFLLAQADGLSNSS